MKFLIFFLLIILLVKGKKNSHNDFSHTTSHTSITSTSKPVTKVSKVIATLDHTKASNVKSFSVKSSTVSELPYSDYLLNKMQWDRVFLNAYLELTSLKEKHISSYEVTSSLHGNKLRQSSLSAVSYVAITAKSKDMEVIVDVYNNLSSPIYTASLSSKIREIATKEDLPLDSINQAVLNSVMVEEIETEKYNSVDISVARPLSPIFFMPLFVLVFVGFCILGCKYYVITRILAHIDNRAEELGVFRYENATRSRCNNKSRGGISTMESLGDTSGFTSNDTNWGNTGGFTSIDTACADNGGFGGNDWDISCGGNDWGSSCTNHHSCTEY